MSDLDRLRELRRQQALRVANASRFKREAEMERYRQLELVVRRMEAEAEATP